ncbi:FUN14 domain-containing protein 1 isoform X3 [Aphidius gifuensis]|uniref:FUN14 domain-containing protein 1 isoform X3 n=1 Tax=Aphidius gifuensis TaxID=684658 RepID=UPI001CDC983E|nr:FUN14 domain-containing protein 1 isoform X3 [Aphidius gifuensis]
MPKLPQPSISGVKKLIKRVKMSQPKKSKENSNKDIQDLDITSEAKTYLDKILGDVSKKSATKQILIGTTSGWVTGFLAMKVGKVVAFSVGGGIIMLQIAANQGYIKVNWDKIQKNAEKLSDKVEEKITGEGPNLMDKVRFWCRQNTCVATSFLGGFVLGLAM